MATKQAFPDSDLRLLAFKLVDKGMSSKEAGDKLHVKKMTVAGWLSWRAKGHYDDDH